MFLQEVPTTLWFMAVTLDRKKDRLFDFIQEQIRLSLLPAVKTFITGICVIQFWQYSLLEAPVHNLLLRTSTMQEWYKKDGYRQRNMHQFMQSV